MAVGIRADQLALYKAEMYKVEREKAIEIDPVYKKVFKVENIKKGAGDKYTQMLNGSGFVKHTTEGQDFVFRAPVQGWTTLVKFLTYSDAVTFSKEAIEDTVKLGNLLKEYAADWTDYAMVAKEKLGVRVFNHGGDTSGDWVFNGTYTGETDASGLLMYDGKPFFAVSGNNWTTKGGAIYYNSVATLAVTPDNFETIYKLATSSNNRGEEDEVKANTVNTALCYPGTDRFLLERIVDTSRGLPSTQLNDKNIYFGIVDQIIPWDYLDSDGGWFVGRRGDDKVVFVERQAQETNFFRDNNNNNYKATVDIRFGVHLKPLARRAWTRAGGNSATGGAAE